ncbi:MAG: cytochrome d ubiquinol oxidase subunit II [Caldilineales bacterium]|nr:cytochrome d ubiquinol oxidase subunit II [Caldilineales bacterium]
MDINFIWFNLLGIILTGYAILDGFDLGVGMLMPFARSDNDRRVFLNSIGPVWDGNEVWLVVGGGVLFAAFPEAYASVTSGFYMAFMLLLLALIFRAVSIEFRSKRDEPRWRSFWDWAFALGSLFIALLLGVALGNIARGVPLDAQHQMRVSLVQALNPYAIIVGVTTVLLFAMHGSIFLVMKTDGDLQTRVRRWVNPLIIAFFAAATITIFATFIMHVHLIENYISHLWYFIFPIAALLVALNIPREINRQRFGWAFISSGAVIALFMIMLAVGLYPYLIYSSLDVNYSLDIWNAASSAKTLNIMLIMALIGMPLVAAYTAAVYWVFRGKVELGPRSY